MAPDNFISFAQHINVMKPASIDDTNPKHLVRIEQMLSDPNYVAEEKVDGCHYLCFGGRFLSTEHVEKTDNYPHLRDFFLSLGFPNLILDGEVNYPGRTSQFCTRVTGSSADIAVSNQHRYGPIHYTLWDILRTPKGNWMMNIPYIKRREILIGFYNHFIKGTSMESVIHVTNATQRDKKSFYEDILARGGEGCVLKQVGSLYVMGKKPMWQWMKLKQKDESDLVLIGFKEATAEYKGGNIEQWPYWKEINGVLRPVTKDYYNGWPGALRLGAYVDGALVDICTCSGLNESLKADLAANPDRFIGRVVKITFMEKTEDGFPRHPRFEMFHEGKLPTECTWNFEE